MELKAIERYINCGEVLWYLRYAKEGWKVHGEQNMLYYIDNILSYLDEFGLPVTRRAAGKLQKFREKLGETEPARLLTSTEATELTIIMIDLEKTLIAEAGGKMAYIVTDKRIDVDKLLHNVPSLMAPEVFESLPNIAMVGFVEAGSCIAFVLPTAAAFHLLRGTEDVLRKFYCLNVKRGRVSLFWYEMVKHLRDRRGNKYGPLLDNLDNIRRNFRNPTQHPDKVYDIEEVQDLFSLCVDVINRMVQLSKISVNKGKHRRALAEEI